MTSKIIPAFKGHETDLFHLQWISLAGGLACPPTIWLGILLIFPLTDAAGEKC
jgi:hypothetical protein